MTKMFMAREKHLPGKNLRGGVNGLPSTITRREVWSGRMEKDWKSIFGKLFCFGNCNSVFNIGPHSTYLDTFLSDFFTWILDTGYMDTGHWILGAGHWTLATGYWILDTGNGY